MAKKGKNINVNIKGANCCGTGICGCKQVSSGVYGLGFIGAAIYGISSATGFWMGVLGVLKALVWPAFLVYHVLRFLGA